MEILCARTTSFCSLCKKPFVAELQISRYLASISYLQTCAIYKLAPRLNFFAWRYMKKSQLQLHRNRSHAAMCKVQSDREENTSLEQLSEADLKRNFVSQQCDELVQYSKTVIDQAQKFGDSKKGFGNGRREETIFDATEVKPLSSKLNEADKKWTKAYANSSTKKKLNEFLTLGKIRLTSFVVLSAMGGHLIAPVSIIPSSLAALSVGVLLTSMSANSMNQFLEAPYDTQMARTQNRPLVKRSLTPEGALCFSVLSGAVGVSTLYWGANALTAGIGLTNVILYTSVYTPLKRISIVNTWIGSLVGALPPLMGWTAATGSLCPTAFIMPLVLYSWQFPHFNALSWNLRSDYSRAGYQMMSVTDPALSKRVAFRHTLMLFPICLAAPLSGLTMWFFALDSTLLNLYFAWLGYQFYRNADSKSARALFRFSLIYLPLVVGLMLCSKYWDCFTLFKDGKLLALRHPGAYHSTARTQAESSLKS